MNYKTCLYYTLYIINTHYKCSNITIVLLIVYILDINVIPYKLLRKVVGSNRKQYIIELMHIFRY